MRQIAIVCAVGLLLAACGSGERTPREKFVHAMLTCGRAAKPVETDMLKLASSQDSDDSRAFAISFKNIAHEHIMNYIETCEPVLPDFDIDSSDDYLNQTAQICKSGLKEEINMFRDLYENNGANFSKDDVMKDYTRLIECQGRLKQISKIEN